MVREYHQKIAYIKQLKLNVLECAKRLAETSPDELGVPKHIHEQFCAIYEAAQLNPAADSTLYRKPTHLEYQLEGFKRYDLIRPLAAERRALHFAVNEDFDTSRNLRRIGFQIAMAVLIAACAVAAVFFPAFAIISGLMAIVLGYLALFPPKLEMFDDFSLQTYGVTETEYQEAKLLVNERPNSDLRHESDISDISLSESEQAFQRHDITNINAPRGYNPRFFKTEEEHIIKRGAQSELQSEDVKNGNRQNRS